MKTINICIFLGLLSSSVVCNAGGLNPPVLTQDQIHIISEQAASLPMPQGGFQPLKTNLPLCDGRYSQEISLSHLQQPLFVVGDNTASYKWLKQYKTVLKSMGALGLVVEAENLDALKKIKEASDGLPIMPASGDALKKAFNVKCYPVLISEHRIEN